MSPFQGFLLNSVIFYSSAGTKPGGFFSPFCDIFHHLRFELFASLWKWFHAAGAAFAQRPQRLLWIALRALRIVATAA